MAVHGQFLVYIKVSQTGTKKHLIYRAIRDRILEYASGFATDSSVTDDGWYIDDVLVTTDVGDMTVQPFSGFSSVGSAGGPFSPSSTIYTITNTGAVPLNWIAYAGAAWMDLTPAGSTIEPGQSTQLTCSINSAANTLSAGNYSGSITIDSQTGNQAIRQVYLTVNEAIDVQPAAGFSSAGKIGGPFSPSTQVIQLQIQALYL